MNRFFFHFVLENVGKNIVYQLNWLEKKNADAAEITSVFTSLYGPGPQTPKCKKSEKGYHNETTVLFNLLQLNYFHMHVDVITWKPTIKCEDGVNKPTYYYLGRYPSRLYFSKIHSLNKPYLFIRKNGLQWEMFAIGAYHPCSLDNTTPNAIANPSVNGETHLKIAQKVTFYPSWSVLYMSNVQYQGWTPSVFKQQALMTLSELADMSVYLKGNTSSVFVSDSSVAMPTNNGPVQVIGTWNIMDDYYETYIFVTPFSWLKFTKGYIPDEIKYNNGRVSVPAKKMKNFLLKNVQQMQVNFDCLFSFQSSIFSLKSDVLICDFQRSLIFDNEQFVKCS